MVAKIIVALAAVSFVGVLSGSTDAWARGGKRGGHGGGMHSAWTGKNMHGGQGKSGHGHFPGQTHRSHGHDHHKKHQHHQNFAQGVWHKASGKQSDFRRNWQGGSSYGGGGDGYGGSVGDVCINSQFCQGVWYQTSPSRSSATYRTNPQAIDK